MEEARKQLAAAAAAKRAKLEERLSASASTSATLEAQIGQLQEDNQHLKDTLENYLEEKKKASQRIAALEASNEENKSKVTYQTTQCTNLTVNI